MAQKNIQLKTQSGAPLHPTGIGTWTFGDYPLFSPGTDAEIDAVRYAISVGQNHIDTAEMYGSGGAERVVGKAIADLSRSNLFIASKLWEDHVGAGHVRPTVETMLKRLNTDYLDMLYIHAPWFDAPWQEAIPQIDDLIDEGLVRYFGVSNFNADQLRTTLDAARHPLAANQMHYSLTHQQEVPDELRKLCSDNGIALVAYRPLERGELLAHPLLQEIARHHDATPSQIALAWLIAREALPIPKALRKTHIEENAAAGTIHLKPMDLELLDSLQN